MWRNWTLTEKLPCSGVKTYKLCEYDELKIAYYDVNCSNERLGPTLLSSTYTK
jgi:hypothetical protein